MTPYIAPSSPIPAEVTANSQSLVRNVGFPRLRASGSLPPTAIRRRPYGERWTCQTKARIATTTTVRITSHRNSLSLTVPMS